MRARRRAPLVLRASVLVYRLALHALTPAFRREAGAEMTATFQRLARRWHRAGAWRLLSGTAGEVWDVLASAARQRRTRVPKVRGRAASVLVGSLRTAVQRVVRRPSYSFAFASTLGAGVSVAAAMFAVVSAVVLRPPPFRSPERLVEVWSARGDAGNEMPGVDAASLLAWRSLPVLDGFEVFHRASDRVITGEGAPEQLSAAYVTPGLFSFLGVAPVLGRGFLAEDGHVGGGRTIVLSHGLWRRRYGGDRAILGRAIELNGEARTVVGVMGPGFRFPEAAEAWLPVAWAPDALKALGGGSVVARLAPGLALDRANERLQVVVDADDALRPGGARPFLVDPFFLGTSQRTKVQLVVFFGAVLLVLLIALANVVSLGVAAAVGRRRELAIHAALGAGRGRLVLQLVAESTVLALLGAAVGLALAGGLLQALVPVMQEVLQLNTGGRVPSIWPDGLLFGLGAVAVAGPAVGLLTAVLARAGAAGAPLNSRSNTDERRSVRLQKALVVAEVALALVLVSGAGLLLNSVVRLARRDPGFEVDRLATLTLRLPAERYPGAAERQAFFQRVEERLRGLPGVTGVARAEVDFPRSGFRFRPQLQAEGGGELTLSLDGKEATPETVGLMFLPEVTVGPGFHAVVGTPLLAGRGFVPADAGTPAVIVSATLARRLWPAGPAVGRQLRVTEREGWLTVIGVAADAVQMGPRDTQGAGMEIYRPLEPIASRPDLSFVLRTDGPAVALLEPVRQAVWALDPLQPMERLSTVEAALRDTTLRERFFLGLITAFAILATLLAAIGLHAVLSQIVARRTREIGIRVALGARAADVVRNAVGVAGVLIALGVVIGIGASLALTRFLRALLFGIEPGDPATMAVNVLVLLAVAFAACLLPTRRALSVDPVRALGAE